MLVHDDDSRSTSKHPSSWGAATPPTRQWPDPSASSRTSCSPDAERPPTYAARVRHASSTKTLIAHEPCLTVLDSRRAAVEPLPAVARLQEDHFEALPSVHMSPCGGGRELTECGTHPFQSTRHPGHRPPISCPSGRRCACGVRLARCMDATGFGAAPIRRRPPSYATTPWPDRPHLHYPRWREPPDDDFV
jgi:hypothetical protein